MGRGKIGCKKGIHQMVPFKVQRKDKKTGIITNTEGVRCKHCKKPEGKHKTRVIQEN